MDKEKELIDQANKLMLTISKDVLYKDNNGVNAVQLFNVCKSTILAR